MDCTTNLMSTIGAMQFLTRNFPDNILDPIVRDNKKYDSIIDLLTDILKSLGVEPIDIVYLLLSHLTGLSKEIIENMDEWIDINADFDIEQEDNGTLQKIETSIKYALSALLTGVLGCSADPILGDKYFDAHTMILSSTSSPSFIEGGIILNRSDFDPLGYLDYCPSSNFGRGYYFDNDMGIGKLYRSMDFNAFLWYAINKSLPAPQSEVNKCMWDNRYTIKRSRTENEWNEWISSKKNKYYDKNEKYENGEVKRGAGNLTCSGLIFKPILQVKPVDTDAQSILVQISSQEYFRTRTIDLKEEPEIKIPKLGFNKTLYEFNLDYLNSIKLFSSKTFITSLIDSFMNGINTNSFQITVNRVLPKEMIRRIIEKSIDSVTSGADTCYFSFSNEEYDSMLSHMEELKYNAKPYLSGSRNMVQIDVDGTEKIKASLVYPDGDERLTLKEAFTDLSLSVTPGKDGSVTVGIANNWFYDFVILIIYQIASVLFSPKIFFILSFNYKMLGLNEDLNIGNLLKNMMTLIIKLVMIIVKTIIEYLIELIWSRLIVQISAYVALRTMEMISDYIEVLQLAIASCIPELRLNLFNYDGDVGDVRYADIIPNKDTPNKDKNC